MNGRIIAHADDFGITPDQSRKILACSTSCGGRGALNSVSVMANSPRFDECAELLRPALDTGRLMAGVHLNVFEGHCCASPEDIGLLVEDGGMFRFGFAGLLAATGGAGREQLKEQLAEECSCQIMRFVDAFPSQRDRLRLDGHQHFHLIPLAFDAVLLAAKRCGCSIEHIRIPAEPIRPYLSTPGIWKAVRPVNVVKTLLLKSLWQLDKRKLPSYRTSSSVFSGVMLSGHMDAIVDPAMLGKLRGIADAKHMGLELLFHPGGLGPQEECLDRRKPGFASFYRSPKRDDEARALEELERCL